VDISIGKNFGKRRTGEIEHPRIAVSPSRHFSVSLHPVDRWQRLVPTDQRSENALNKGFFFNLGHPVDRWNDYEGGATSSLIRCPVGQAVGQRLGGREIP
jgi:hypothetical protein